MATLVEGKPVVLWLAPNLNHYKARLLAKLSGCQCVQLIVACGAADKASGHTYDYGIDNKFETVRIAVAKNRWGYDPRAWHVLLQCVRERKPNIVLVPAETKHFGLIVGLSLLRRSYNYQLFSYNHSRIDRHGRTSFGSKAVTRLMFSMYDRLVFYNELDRERAVVAGVVDRQKASFAYKTLDIESTRSSRGGPSSGSAHPTILFMGRLLEQKGIAKLFQYYDRLCDRVTGLRLEIIGDGPLRETVANRVKADSRITWHGAISDESQIAEIVDRATLAFIPGETGLGIVHAFAYGKPFATINLPEINHGPEFDFLEHGKNGLSLSGNVDQDIAEIERVLIDESFRAELSRGAYETGTRYSAGEWVRNVCDALCGGDRSSIRPGGI